MYEEILFLGDPFRVGVMISVYISLSVYLILW